MCFLADGPIGHGAGLEALHQAFDRLHFIDRHRVAALEVQQTAQRAQLLRLVVDQLRVRPVSLVAAGTHRLLQAVDRLGIEQVIFAVGAPLILSAGRQHLVVGIALAKGRVMAQQHFPGNRLDVDATNARTRPREVFVNHILTQSHGLEHLRTVIALHRRDAHLGHHLDDALGGGLDEVLARQFVVDVGQQAVTDHAVDGLEGEVRIDGAAAVTDQQREMMDLARFAGLEHQADARAQAFAYQEVMQAGHGQQRRHGRELRIHAAVAEDQDVDLVLFDHAPRHQAQLFHAFGQPGGATRSTEQDRQYADLEPRQLHVADARKILVGQNRAVELQLPAGGRARLQQVALGAQQHVAGGDQFFAYAVDRRIGHLREHRQWRVVAHGARGFDATAAHRIDDDALVLEGVAEGDLPMQQRSVVDGRQRRRRRQVPQRDQVLSQPLPVGSLVRDRILDFFVLDDAALRRVDQEHAPGLQPALAHHLLGRKFQHAGFRGHDHQIIARHVVARRPQAVAIQHRADLRAIGEGNGRRAIPGLHHAAMVLVEGPQRIAHALVRLPGLGNHHHHRVRQ